MAQQQQQFRGEPREKNALDDPKLKLYADPVSGAKGAPTLHLYYTNANPRINVYTNLPGDKDDGKISAALDQTALGEFFVTLKDLCDPATPNGTAFVMDNKRGGKEKGELFVESYLSMGKDKDGRIYISVVARDSSRPKIRFYFGSGLFHVVSKIVNGEKVPDSVESISRRRALGWVNRVEGIFDVITSLKYTHPEPKDRNGGNRGGGSYGGGNRGGGGGNRGGYNGGGDDNEFEAAAKPAAGGGGGFDDDIPF